MPSGAICFISHLHCGRISGKELFLRSKPMDILEPNDTVMADKEFLIEEEVEGLKPSLAAPYQGPFEVLSRTDKHFTIKINDRTSTIGIDRLKPAFLLNDTDSTNEPFPVQKSNHPVVLPPRRSKCVHTSNDSLW
ncbi:hypothetical protein TNIN_49421 [Trichonephila inaurata madagascariensis]|uniref:DDE Tnp4 domain-containing protein n=1 Tax=Trichonephila inaurata madagascariensis TaxID=2747483 RepID=A0A8X6X6C0_9ARAC|nr:hypothetical protein TNIN_49421 [Trichonephila inaurata madagascariensis]